MEGNDVSAAGGAPDAATGESKEAPDIAGAGAPSGDSLLTRSEETAAGAADGTDKEQASDPASQGADKDGAKDKPDPAALVPEKPDGYDLKFAEGVTVDEALLKSFQAKAHELGIPQGQAQQLADFYTKNMGDSAKAIQQAQVSALTEAKKGWEAEITARPGFRQEVADAKRTLKEFGSPELNEIMDQTLLGSHPVFFDFMVKVGKALAEPNSRGAGNDAGKEKPLMHRLWPGMK